MIARVFRTDRAKKWRGQILPGTYGTKINKESLISLFKSDPSSLLTLFLFCKEAVQAYFFVFTNDFVLFVVVVFL